MTSTTLGVAVRPCPVCSKPYESKAGSCSPSCGGVLAARTRGHAAQRIGRACQVCGTTYRATYSAQRTCSRACGNVLRYGPPQPKPVPVQRALTLAQCRCGALFLSEHPDRSWCDPCRLAGRHRYQPVDDEQRDCPECSTTFLAAFTGGRRPLYCSRDCRITAIRRKHDAGLRFRVSRAVRLSIYRRDGWRCHLCGHAVMDAHGKTWRSGQPWSASLDHLQPRSRGGSDDPANLATAHLWCNVMRGIDDIPDRWPHGAPPASW